MGFFDGFGKHVRLGRRDRQLNSLDVMAAEADATRIRLSDATYEGASRIPASDEPEAESGPERHAMPAERPDPRAQWDGIRGVWVVYDESVNDWVPYS